MNVIEALLELEASNITSLVVGPLIGSHCGDANYLPTVVHIDANCPLYAATLLTS